MFDQVGVALKALREMAGLSQAELARKAGMGKSQVSKYERGQNLPNLASLRKILRAVKVEPLFFFYLAHILESQARAKPGMSATLIEGEGIAFLLDAEAAAYRDVFQQFVTLFEKAAQARVLQSGKKG
jgi:transcriptional regulator with XRE-family HTH domain